MMTRIRTIAALLLLTVTSTTQADFKDGLQAYESGLYDIALEHFESAAKLGHAESQFNLGVLYYNGDGVEQDLVEAYGWLSLAAENGMQDALPLLANLESFVDQSGQDEGLRRVSAYNLESLAQSLVPDAITESRRESAPTEPVVEDDENQDVRPIRQTAPRYPREAALEGREGYVSLEFTIEIDGSIRDISVVDASERIFVRPATDAVADWRFSPRVRDGRRVPQRASVLLQFNLGDSSGPTVTSANSPDHLVRKAEAGDAHAQYDLARVMDSHPQFRDRRASILDLYFRSAVSGFAPAQFQLSQMVEKGDACEKDRAKAITWARLAADQDFTPSMVQLAEWHRYGDARDLRTAAYWLRLAADLGSVMASKYLAAISVMDDADFQDAEEALLLTKAVLDSGRDWDPEVYEIRAMAHALLGNFGDAVRAQRKAVKAAKRIDWDMDPIDARLDAYKDDFVPEFDPLF